MTKQIEQLQTCENTDTKLWSEPPKDYYSSSIHVTKNNKIGIDVGGNVFVKSLSEWHNLASEALAETQEPKPPTILARLPNGATVSNVYEAYEAGLKEGKAETQEPVALADALEHCDGADCTCYADYQGECVCGADWTHSEVIKARHILNTTPPSREWVGLSDVEIEEAVNYLNIKIDYPIMFARLIEMHLKEKNNGLDVG